MNQGRRAKTKANRRQYTNSLLRALEWEVRLYHETKKELDDFKENREAIMTGARQRPDGMPHGSGVSDVTYSRVVRLLELNTWEIREMSRKVEAIERAIADWCACDPVSRGAFIRLKFWDKHLTNEGIAQKIGISERSVKYWRKGFLILVGKYLGWRV